MTTLRVVRLSFFLGTSLVGCTIADPYLGLVIAHHEIAAAIKGGGGHDECAVPPWRSWTCLLLHFTAVLTLEVLVLRRGPLVLAGTVLVR
jgi:hypothetical protein